jgi:hypothetical protein
VDSQEIINRFMTRYGPEAGEMGPVLFVTEVLGGEPDDWQEEVLKDMGRGERNISIRACHGVGKTAVVAWLIIIHMVTRFPQKTVATAPTRSQLFDNLYAEVVMWADQLPPAVQKLFHIKSDRIEFIPKPKKSFFSARTAKPEQPEALQGVHSDHVLIAIDEGSGVPDAIYESGSGSMTDDNALTIMISNPTRTSGYFFDSFHRLGILWKQYHIGSYYGEWGADGPPEDVWLSKRAGKKYALEQAIRYGIGSAAYRIRVLGEFPEMDDESVIPYHLVDSARKRELDLPPDYPRVWGVDVARFGSARNALTERTKRSATVLDVWEQMDTMQTVSKIKRRWDDTPPSQRPYVILIDVNGIGAGVVDRLWEMKLPVRGVNVSESAAQSDRFMRSRDELWWLAREWLEGKDVTLEVDEDDSNGPNELLAAELVQPAYDFSSSGKVVVESKKDMKKRLKVASPDVADSFVMTFAEDLAFASGPGATGANDPDWNSELPSRVTNIP